MSLKSALPNIPLGPPPPGQQSDFDAPAPDATVLWVLGILTCTLAFIGVMIRLWIKHCVQKQRITWDDGRFQDQTTG
jgi:hypothetical protein